MNNHNDTVVAALTAEQARTREILERLFPNAAIKTSALICNVEDYSEWLNIFTSNIDSQLDNSSVHSSNNKEVVKNHRDNGTTDGAVDDSVRQTTEELILQNAKLKTTVDEYKTIVAETVSQYFRWPQWNSFYKYIISCKQNILLIIHQCFNLIN